MITCAFEKYIRLLRKHSNCKRSLLKVILLVILVIEGTNFCRTNQYRVSHSPLNCNSTDCKSSSQKLTHQYSGFVHDEKRSADKRPTLLVVISTLMAKGTLSGNFIHSCLHSKFLRGAEFYHSCKDNRAVIESQDISTSAQEVKAYLEQNPGGKCTVVTAIRSPVSWLQSQYLQSRVGLSCISAMTKEELINDYKKFLRTFKILQEIGDCLPQLLEEFNGGSLAEQFEIMDENGGYSILPSSKSKFEACELLFLRLEQSNQWEEYIQKMKLVDNLVLKTIMSMKLINSIVFIAVIK